MARIVFADIRALVHKTAAHEDAFYREVDSFSVVAAAALEAIRATAS